jgi:DNA invertase Pin-like site-specific DNA recombinase
LCGRDLYEDSDFAVLFPTQRQPDLSPGRRALVPPRQFLVNLSNDQAAEIIRASRAVETGQRSDQPELLKAIAPTQRSKATHVIAQRDRLARKVAFTANLRESGVDFVACDTPQANRLPIPSLAAVAETKAKMISERTRAALAVY